MIKRVFCLLLTAVSLTALLFSIITYYSRAGTGAPILIDAVYYDGLETGDPDEAVRIRNISGSAVDIGEWELTDNVSTAVIPSGTLLAAGDAIWLADEAAAFARQFGFLPDFEMPDTNGQVPDLTGAWPGFSNSGDEVVLKDQDGNIVDVLVYEGGDTMQSGWSGTAVQPYVPTTSFAANGQILYRRRDQLTGLPVPDTDTVADWAQSMDDVINGRKVRYPGWDVDDFFFTTRITETAVLTVAIAPDNAYHVIEAQINGAQSSIQIETLTFENMGISNALIEAVNRGVTVTVLLEGGPSGGVPDQELYICQQLETADPDTGRGQCWFMINDTANQIYDRYRFLHAKFMLIDGERVVIGSENLSPNSLPDDDKSDGTWGRRGVVLVTDAPGVVSHIQSIFDHDLDAANHVDLFRWDAPDGTYGEPPPGFTPILETGGITYTVRHPEPLTLVGEFAFELVQSPENSMRDQDGLLGLVNRAGAGDTILVQQLNERPYWGPSSSNALDDPNPRVEAYVDAARRGALVRILLDAFFDDGGETSNAATCRYVNNIARLEGLSLSCRLGNPSGLGIHNKMVLAHINGRGTIHVGSINGTEMSQKGNRELALQVQSDAAYTLLAQMFDQDWGYPVYLPVVFSNYIPPASYVLISEVLFNPSGPDDAEYIELANPTGQVMNISDYSLGDAVNKSDFEDVRRFPPGTTIPPGGTLVIATTATAFHDRYLVNPDFEILSTDAAVPDLLDDPTWGNTAAFLQLGNTGDEIIFRDAGDKVIDVVTYGSGSYPGVVGCELNEDDPIEFSLERSPYWQDTDDCTADFRKWPFPNPGDLP